MVPVLQLKIHIKMGWDVALLESGDGGDITMNGNDIGVYYQDENEIYIRMFGGNIEADTKINRKNGERDVSFWGNKLFFNNDPNVSFNSLTERTLKLTELTSKGRSIIENAIKKDLQGLNCTILVQIISTDRIRITLQNKLPDGSESIKKYELVRNPLTGDFDLNDFDPNDFL